MTKVAARPSKPRVLVHHNDLDEPSPRERFAARFQRDHEPPKRRDPRPGEQTAAPPARDEARELTRSVVDAGPLLLFGPAFRRVYRDARRSCVECRGLATYLWKETSRGEVFLCDGCKAAAARRSTGFVGLAEPLSAGRATGGSFEGEPAPPLRPAPGLG